LPVVKLYVDQICQAFSGAWQVGQDSFYSERGKIAH
jgi:hypothetical protein